MAPVPGVGSVIVRGGQSAQEMQQSSASSPSPGAFDVWSHSYEGMAARMDAAARDPAAFLAGDPAQQARGDAAAMPGEWDRVTVDQAVASIATQASTLDDQVQAIRNADGALKTVGATFALLTGVEQMISSVLSVIPFPAFPAVRITDMDIGLPHAHAHPPNLIPPAPPVPLPSTGPVIPIPILSGASQTLINGMPAARCGDMGLAIWCGGYFPMYEIFLGSSSVWIEGSRAARVAVDITKHCIFTTPRPQDPPLGPMVGTTISSSPNVVIGGVPMPSLLALGMGRALKGLSALAGKGARAFSRVTAPLRRRFADALGLQAGFLKCSVLRAEPVNLVTGEVVVAQLDFSIPGPIRLLWTRHYGSARPRLGVCGHGWETPADARLTLHDDGTVAFHDGQGRCSIFPHLPRPEMVARALGDGAILRRRDDLLIVQPRRGPRYEFRPPTPAHAETLVERVADLCGNDLRYVRDGNGLRHIVESAGRTLEVTSRRGLIHEMQLHPSDAAAPRLMVRYEYSSDGDLVSVIDALGHPYRFQYLDHRLIRHTSRTGLSFHYEYDAAGPTGRCHHAWGDGGLYDYRFAHDPVLRRLTVTNSLHQVATIQLNDWTLPAWELDPTGGLTRYEYDALGRACAIVDPGGLRTEYHYDDRGNLLTLVRPDGATIETIYSDDNRPMATKDPNGSWWRQDWDHRGLLLRETGPTGAATAYFYNDRGCVTAVTDPRGHVSRIDVNRFGQAQEIIAPDGRSVRCTFDALGNLIDQTDPSGLRWLYEYDAKSRLIRATTPGGDSATCQYDADDRPVLYRDVDGHVTRFEYAGLGQLVRRTRADGATVLYRYDTEERLVGIVNPRGEIYTLRRDALGRPVEETDYWGQSVTYTYDPSGRLCLTEDALGNTMSITTDAIGRLVERRLPDGWHESFAYDRNGNVVGTRTPETTIAREFGLTGRLLKEVCDGFAVEYSHDPAGNLAERRSSAGNVVRYEYDALNALVRVVINDQVQVDISRDPAGRIASEVFSTGCRRRYHTDGRGRRIGRDVEGARGSLVRVGYRYDRGGELVGIDHGQLGPERFRYDALGRIRQYRGPEGQVQDYEHDAADDLIQMTWQGGASADTYRRTGRYQGRGYSFDANGNLVERTAANETLRLSWGAHGRLLKAETAGESGSVSVCSYGYDAQGRRVSKDVDGRRSDFRWDGDALLWEGSADGVGREYVYYPRTFEPLARIEADGTVLVFQNDPNGLPREVTDGGGTVVWQARYDPHAGLTSVTRADIDQPLRLLGQYCDPETGLHYNRNRYYDPALGSFISCDPLGLAAGLNLYRLAPNVWRWADPLGLTCSIHLDYAMELARRLFDQSEWIREIQRISRIGDLGQRYAAISDFMANYGRATGIRIEIVPSHQASQFGIGPSNWGTYRPAESRILMHEDIFTAPRVNPVDQIGHEVGAAELDRVFGIPKDSVPAIHRTLPGRNYLTHVADMLY